MQANNAAIVQVILYCAVVYSSTMYCKFTVQYSTSTYEYFRTPVSGVCSAGLATTVQPAARAVTTLWRKMQPGKFHYRTQ